MQDFKNITVANPFNAENQTWAVCYLRQEGDERNVLKLDNVNLSIRKRGRLKTFFISEIDNIILGHKRLLLPLIIGGIISPLALIAIYENAYSSIPSAFSIFRRDISVVPGVVRL